MSGYYFTGEQEAIKAAKIEYLVQYLKNRGVNWRVGCAGGAPGGKAVGSDDKSGYIELMIHDCVDDLSVGANRHIQFWTGEGINVLTADMVPDSFVDAVHYSDGRLRLRFKPIQQHIGPE
jgi:hypothetical protein